jgi:hypothetical protein
MPSAPKENCPEMLRARYAELLRLRKYVEQLETLHNENAAPDPNVRSIDLVQKVPGAHLAIIYS